MVVRRGWSGASGGCWSVAADNNNLARAAATADGIQSSKDWNSRGQSSLKVSLQIEWERQQITSKTYLNICRHLAFSGARPVFEAALGVGVGVGALLSICELNPRLCECALGRVAWCRCRCQCLTKRHGGAVNEIDTFPACKCAEEAFSDGYT